MFNNAEAHLIKSKLESERILYVLFDKNMIELYDLYDVAIGDINIKIHQKDYEKACAVLEESKQE